MGKERAGIEHIEAQQPFPLIGEGPAREAARRQGVRGRAQPEHVENQGLVVTLPAVVQEAEFGHPPLGQGRGIVLGPAPVDPLVECLRCIADLGLLRAVEIATHRQHAGQQQRGVNQRELAVPHARAGLHVQEMVVKAAVAGCLRIVGLAAREQKAQRNQRLLRRLRAREPATLARDDAAGKGKAHHRDAARCPGARSVRDQTVARVGIADQILIGRTLQRSQERLILGVKGGHRWLVADPGVAPRTHAPALLTIGNH